MAFPLELEDGFRDRECMNVCVTRVTNKVERRLEKSEGKKEEGREEKEQCCGPSLLRSKKRRKRKERTYYV